MRLLLDTHCAIWAIYDQMRFGTQARELLERPDTNLFFSAVSIAEISIKRTLNRPDFPFEPEEVRDALLSADYVEIALAGEHAVQLRSLPLIHRDPFDRMLVAQARSERAILLTADATISRYPVETLLLS